MTKELQLGIPTPCSDNWSQMSPGRLSAQAHRAPPPMSQQIPSNPQDDVIQGKITALPQKPLVDSILGRVTDAKSQPVVSATVLYGPKKGVITDDRGYFAIAASKVSMQQTLAISAVGYEMTHI